MYFNQRKFIRRLAAASSLLFSAGALAEPVGFWTGNGSIISYYDSQGRANMQDGEYPYGVKRDMTMTHPGYPVAFFQWQAAPGCERLEISAEAPNNVNMVDITVGNWSSRDNDVTFENASLPFVIGNGNGDVTGILAAMGTFNFDYQQYPDANWRVVSVAFKYPVTEESKAFATCTDQTPSTYPFAGPGKPIILEGNYKWNGNGSIISRLFSHQEPGGFGGEWPLGAFGDITQVSPSPERPVVFFQWMASEICTELTIDAPDLFLPHEKQVTITSKPWYVSNDDVLAEKMYGMLPMTLHNHSFREEPPWRVIQVAFDYPVSQQARVEAKCSGEEGGGPVAQPLSMEAHSGEKVKILNASSADNFMYEILAASSTSITGCDSVYRTDIPHVNEPGSNVSSPSDMTWYCDVTPGFVGTIYIPYRLKDTQGRYSDSTVTITVSPVPTPPPPSLNSQEKIRNVGNSLCLASSGNNQQVDQAVITGTCDFTDSDWYFEGTKIRNRWSPGCLASAGNSEELGNSVVLSLDCNSPENTDWYRDGNKIRNFRGPNCLSSDTLQRFVIMGTCDSVSSDWAYETPVVKVDSSPLAPPEGQGVSLTGDEDLRWPTGYTLKVAMDFSNASRMARPWPCEVADIQNNNWQPCFNKVATNIMNFANKWSKYGNIHFQFNVPWESADIRIRFDEPNRAYSRGIGRKILSHPKDQKTMNLGFGFLQNEEEFRGTVLHEFGHAIGLYHEHNSPNVAYTWDREKVIADLLEWNKGWTRADAIHNVLAGLPSDQGIFDTEFDPNSIMIYFIPSEWVSQVDLDNPESCPDYYVYSPCGILECPPPTKSGYCVKPKNDLSAWDKAGIGQFYPR